MVMQASGCITLIEIEALDDASSVSISKGGNRFTLTQHELCEFIHALICVDRYLDKVHERQRIN